MIMIWLLLPYIKQFVSERCVYQNGVIFLPEKLLIQTNL